MKITTLEGIGMPILTETYNLGFSDYVIKFNADEHYLSDRWAGGRVKLSYSAGGWVNDQLSGLLISGIDDWAGKKTAFNAATCVAPNARGNKFTRKAYDFLIPKFKALGVEALRLEVIQSNERAVSVYKKIGFEIERPLLCFKGTPSLDKTADNQYFTFEKKNHFDFEKYAHFINFQPSWEHLPAAINLKWSAHDCFTLSKNEELLAYVILAKKDGRIKQLYTNPKEKGNGYNELLISKVKKYYPQLLVVNVDGHDEELVRFYEKIGLKRSFSQFEMSREI